MSGPSCPVEDIRKAIDTERRSEVICAAQKYDPSGSLAGYKDLGHDAESGTEVEKVEIGLATLYFGDCMEVLPTLGKVDAMITDPPYGIADVWKGGKGHGWGKADKDKAIRNEWDAKAPEEKHFADWLAICTEAIIWGGNYFKLPTSRGWLVWTKPERNFTLSEAELAWTNKDTIMRVFDGVRSDPDRQHPTQKPISLMRWCVTKVKGKTIVDPYMGSGTTGVAVVEEGRKFIGVEAHRPYFDIACERIDQAQRQGKLF